MQASVIPSFGELRIRLLGGIELCGHGKPLQLPASRRTRALLGFLVETARPHSRSSLCDLLWDGPDDPRASLRWSLTKLRAVFEEGAGACLCTDRDKVFLQATSAVIDTRQVLVALDRHDPETMPLPDLEALAGLLRGEFLDGLDLPACYRFHHWCVERREHYGGVRRQVLGAVTARLADQPERALPYGHAMVEADPLAEAAHATLVRLLGAAGRYLQAERHYEWARDLLRREVAMAAGGPLDHVIHQVRRDLRGVQGPSGDARQVWPAPMASAVVSGGGGGLIAAGRHSGEEDEPGSRRTQPLLGRHRESSAIADALAGRLQPSLLLFVGEPGIGKTCLLDRFAAVAMAAGYEVIRGRCFEAETVRPYGLWLDALRGVSTSSIDESILVQAAPLLEGELRAVGSRDGLFDAVLTLLRGMAGHRPIALAFDDLQWIDEGSAALLHFAARHCVDHAGIVFVGAARAGEVDENACARRLLQSLSRETLVMRIDLAPLSLQDATALLGALRPAAGAGAPAELSTADAEAAWRLSGGNPLYLVELSRTAHHGDEAGEGIDALIGARLRALEDDARELLSWAAAAGREVDPLLLAEASGLPSADVLARLLRLERHGLLVSAGRGGQVDFAHDLIRETLYRSLSQPRRQAIHAQYVRALQRATDQDPALHGEIIRHAELAGNDLAAAQACLAAGQHCLRLFANPQAADVAARGLRRLDALAPGAQRLRLEIGLLRVRVAAAAGPAGRRLPEVADQVQRAVADADAFGLADEAASGWELLAYLRQWSSDIGDAREATLAAERMTRRGDATAHCIQLANSGRCLLDIEADLVRGRELLAEATAQAAALDLQVMEIDWGRGLIARAEGDLEAARAALTAAVVLARRATNHWREFECMVWLATVELEQGRHVDVVRHVEEIVAATARMGEEAAPFAQALGALARLRSPGAGVGRIAGKRQREQAARDLRSSLAAMRDRDDKAHLAYALNEAAALALAAGRPDDAAIHAAEALVAALAVHRGTETAVAAARLAVACACGAVSGDPMLVGQARKMVDDWPRSWAVSGAPTARAVAAMAALSSAASIEPKSGAHLAPAAGGPISTLAQTPAS